MAIYLGDLELATGGGATGTGLPVNSYESFFLDTTGNPPGYDATTGLYTHPNGDKWLKTGSTFNGTPSDYPDAKGALAINFTYTNFTFTQPRQFQADIVAPTDGFLYISDASNGKIRRYNKQTGADTGFSFNAGVSYLGAIGSNGSDNILVGGINDVVTEYTTAGVATGFSFNASAQLPGNNRIQSLDSDGTYIYLYNNYTDSAYRYDMSGNYTNHEVIMPGSSAGQGFTVLENGMVMKFDPEEVAFQETGAAVSTQNLAATHGGMDREDNTKLWTTYYGDVKSYTINPLVKTMGDSTARTDSDSGQPLFLKIK